MWRLYLPFFVALLILAVPRELAGQWEHDRLAELPEVRIVAEGLMGDIEKSGLNKESLTNHTLALLRKKLPRLVINKSAESFLYVNARLSRLGEEKTVYYGAVWVGVYRPVIIKKTGKSISAMVWFRARSITGPLDDAVTHVRGNLDILITHFAAHWHRGNR